MEYFSSTPLGAMVKESTAVVNALSLTMASWALVQYLLSELEKTAVRKGCQAALREVKQQTNLLHPALLARAKLAIALKLD